MRRSLWAFVVLCAACGSSSPTTPTPLPAAPSPIYDLRVSILSATFTDVGVPGVLSVSPAYRVRGQVTNLGPDCATQVDVSVGAFTRTPPVTRGIFVVKTIRATGLLRPGEAADYELLIEGLVDTSTMTTTSAAIGARCQ